MADRNHSSYWGLPGPSRFLSKQEVQQLELQQNLSQAAASTPQVNTGASSQAMEAFNKQLEAQTQAMEVAAAKLSDLPKVLQQFETTLQNLNEPLKAFQTAAANAASNFPSPTKDQTKNALSGALSSSASTATKTFQAINEETDPVKEGGGTTGATASPGFMDRMKAMYSGASDRAKSAITGQPAEETNWADTLQAAPGHLAGSMIKASGHTLANYAPLALWERHRQRTDQAQEMAGSLIPNLGDASTLGYSSRGSYVGEAGGPGFQLPFTSAAAQAQISQQFEKMKYALMPGVGMGGASSIFNNLYGLGWTQGDRTNAMRQGLAGLTQQNYALGTSPQVATMMDQATRFANGSIQDFISLMQQIPHVAQQTSLSMSTVLQSIEDYQSWATQQGTDPFAAQKAGAAITQQTGLPFSSVQPALQSPLGNAMLLQNTGLSPLTMGAALGDPNAVGGAASQTITGLFQQLLPQFQPITEPDGTVISASSQAQAAVAKMLGLPAQAVERYTQSKGTAKANVNLGNGQTLKKGQQIYAGTEMSLQGNVTSKINQAQQHMQWIQGLANPADRQKYLQQFYASQQYGPQGILSTMRQMNQADPGLYTNAQMKRVRDKLMNPVASTKNNALISDLESSQSDTGAENSNFNHSKYLTKAQQQSLNQYVNRTSSHEDTSQAVKEWLKQNPAVAQSVQTGDISKALDKVDSEVRGIDATHNAPGGKGKKSASSGNVTVTLDPQTARYFNLMANGTPPSQSATAKALSYFGQAQPNQGGGNAYNNPNSLIPGP